MGSKEKTVQANFNTPIEQTIQINLVPGKGGHNSF